MVDAAMAAPSPRAESDIKLSEAAMPPSTVAVARHTPCEAPWVRHNAADGPGVTITASTTET